MDIYDVSFCDNIFSIGLATTFTRNLRSIYVYGNLDNEKKDIDVDPSKTIVKPHTTVVWHNKSDSDIKLVFLDGKVCKKASKATLGLRMAEACYVTGHIIPTGGTTSASFTRLGSFNYEVEYIGKNHKEKGSIRVRYYKTYPHNHP